MKSNSPLDKTVIVESVKEVNEFPSINNKFK